MGGRRDGRNRNVVRGEVGVDHLDQGGLAAANVDVGKGQGHQLTN